MSLTRSEAALELGKKLVARLETADDLLASWMVHYIAERIEAAENAPPGDASAAQDAAARAILELWRYRSALPNHLRPLGELEPVQRTLASLDLDRTDFRYYPAALREAATADADDESKQWLELALGLDYAARSLVRLALHSAAHRAATKAQPWVELALQAGADEVAESVTVEFILGSPEDDSAEQRDDAALMERVTQLESFAKTAALVARNLRATLSPNASAPRRRR